MIPLNCQGSKRSSSTRARATTTLALAVISLALMASSGPCGPGYGAPYDQQLWDYVNSQHWPQWFPDGSRILFSHTGRVFVIDTEGTNLQALSGNVPPAYVGSDSRLQDFSPALSPDGAQIAFTTLRYAKGDWLDPEHNYEIARQFVDGSERHRLTNNERHDVSPSWSPDGTWIAFVGSTVPGSFGPLHRGGGRLYTVAADGGDERNLAPSVDVLPLPPVWSPDGQRLAFLAVESKEVSYRWVDTSALRRTPERLRTTPTPQSTTQTLYYYVPYVVDADGSNLVRLKWVDDPSAPPRVRMGYHNDALIEHIVHMPTWSPDGARLAFTARVYGDELSVFVADLSGEARQVASWNQMQQSLQTVQSAALHNISNMSWSEDGTAVRFWAAVGVWDHNSSVEYIAGHLEAESGGSDLRLLKKLDEREKYGWSTGYRWQSPFFTASPDGSAFVFYDPKPGQGHDVVAYLIPVDELDERNLVRQVDQQLLPANPTFRNQPVSARECSAGTVVPNPRRNDGLVADCSILLNVRNSLAGDGVLYWTPDTSIFDWPGVVVEGNPPRVVAIESVTGSKLTGSIPPELGNLAELRILDLSGNDLSGPIPPGLGKLNKLERLDLRDGGSLRDISGAIPPELGQLTNLNYLDLSGTNLNSSIPPELGNLSNLEELHLVRMPLQGQIPPELWNLTNLRKLVIEARDGELYGTVPPEVGRLVDLDTLIITGAMLSGPLPSEIGDLVELRELRLRSDRSKMPGSGLTGPIPAELANLKHLRRLGLSQNKLSGDIPRELDTIRPSTIALDHNLLTGCAPAEWKSLRNVYVGRMRFCGDPGAVPR